MKKILCAIAVLFLVGLCLLFYCQWHWIVAHRALIFGLLTPGILLVALIIAIFTLRAMRHDRATSIAMTLSQMYDSGIMFEARLMVKRILIEQENRGIQDIQRSFLNTVDYYKGNYTEEFTKLTAIPAFFDLIGWLVRRRCCDTHAIDEQLDWELPYTLWEGYIRQTQHKKEGEALDDSPSAFYGNFVWLANQLRRQQ